jgi:hypothetical protein
MVRKILGLFSSSGAQQQQPFVQVTADNRIWDQVASSSSNWHRLDRNADEFLIPNRTDCLVFLST